MVANIPAEVTVLPQGAGSGVAELPEGESNRYIFSVHALDMTTLEVDEGASGAMLGFL